MGARRILVSGLAIAVLLTLATFAAGAASPVAAAGVCPADADACLIVNSTADSNIRDSVLTLREAVALANGELVVGELAPNERRQVYLNTPHGLSAQGADHIYFDGGVFASHGAAHTGIMLHLGGLRLLPGSSGVGTNVRARHLYRGSIQMASDDGQDLLPLSPPDIGRGPGGGGGVLGGAIDPVSGEPVSTSVTIDGGALDVDGASVSCLAIEAEGIWVRGLTFRGCDVAIAVASAVAGSTLIGADGDGYYDAYEQVQYVDCDVATTIY